MRTFFIPLVVVALLQGCIVPDDPKPDPAITAEMNRLEIALRRLGAAVDGLLWSGAPQDGDLIAMACKNDPSLCSALGSNRHAVKAVDGHAVLLLCTPDNKRALVEDIACTPTPDRKAWESGNEPCRFTFSDQQVRDACR